MSHLSIRPHDHGQIDFGCDSYGGLAYRLPQRHTRTQAAPSISGATRRVHLTRKKFISEHNLAWYWRRPGLFPRSQGFPVPLLETANDYATGIRSRPMGMLRFDLDRTQCLLNRNLLAGEQSRASDKYLSLWAVNDLSDRRTLLHYPLRYQKLNHFRRGRLLRVERAPPPSGGDDGDENRGEPSCLPIQLPDEAYQLRSFVSSTKERQVLVRTGKSLLLVDADNIPEEPSISCVCRTPVRSFTQIPHLEDEMATIDATGALCWGSVDAQLDERVRLDDELQVVVPTDCPRVLVAMAEQKLVEVDLRVSRNNDNAPTQVLYSREEKLGKPACMPENVYECNAGRERFCHCLSVDVARETMLLTTTRRHLLIDRRMPNSTLLSIGHSEMNGGDHCLVTPPFQDPDTDASIYSLYTLTQTCRPSLSHWSFAFHPTERIWSSLGAKYELDSPGVGAARFAKCHGLEELLGRGEPYLPRHTRAIHYHTLPEGLATRNQVALLFRQMDGGEIWYETVLFDPLYCNDYREELATEEGQVGDHHLQAILTGGDTATRSSTTKTTKEEEGDVWGQQPSMLAPAQSAERPPPEEELEPICQYEMRVKSLELIGRHLRDRDQADHGRQRSTRIIYFDGVDEELLEDAKQLATPFNLRLNLPPTRYLDEMPAGDEWDPFAAVGQQEETSLNPQHKAMVPEEDVEVASASGRLLSEVVMKMRAKTLHYLHNKRKPFSARRRREDDDAAGPKNDEQQQAPPLPEESGDETKASTIDQSGSKMEEEEDEEWTSASRYF